MIETKPTTLEIENMITRVEEQRKTWRGNAGYARCLDIELHALRLLLIVTRIEDDERDIADTLGLADG